MAKRGAQQPPTNYRLPLGKKSVGRPDAVATGGPRFIDLFAGIGGIRMAFERAGGRCVFSSEIDAHSRKTYAANFGEEPAGDINAVDLADIPAHDILTGGFPCQPFSLAGVSKKQSLGREHGFRDRTQGTLFFRIAQILEQCRPPVIFLENVKHLLRHDSGRTFAVVLGTLEELGYEVHYQVIDARTYVPQHRERIYIVGFARGAFANGVNFSFPQPREANPRLGDILEEQVESRYVLSDHLWQWHQDYAQKHRQKGNGFGYGLVSEQDTTRTLSARYHKDGAEILVARPGGNPRRLTPRECARLMGYDDSFVIPVSNTQAYRQFGNSVVVPLITEIAHAVVEAMQGRVKADVSLAGRDSGSAGRSSAVV